MNIMNSSSKTCLEVFQQKHAIETIMKIGSHGPIGFNELQESLGVNTATLQRRLEDLYEKQFIKKQSKDTDKRAVDYVLSQRGDEVFRMLNEFKDYLVVTTP